MRRRAARIPRRGSSGGHSSAGANRAAAHRSGSIQPSSLGIFCSDLAAAFRRLGTRAPQRRTARCGPGPPACEPHRTSWNDRASDRGRRRGCDVRLRARGSELRCFASHRIRGALAGFFSHDHIAIDGGDRQQRANSPSRARRRRTPRVHRRGRALSRNRASSRT